MLYLVIELLNFNLRDFSPSELGDVNRGVDSSDLNGEFIKKYLKIYNKKRS